MKICIFDHLLGVKCGTGIHRFLTIIEYFMDSHNCGESLIRDIDSGDGQAFEALFHKFYASLCYFANKYLRDEDAARDVVQEVFIRLYEKSLNFPNLAALKSYLYECVQHKSLNYLEKKNTRAAIRQRLNQEETTEHESLFHQIETEMFEEIFKAIEELPPECKRIFRMSYIDGMDIRQIAGQLNLSETTIKTQRQRAKKYLRKRLDSFCYLSAIALFSSL